MYMGIRIELQPRDRKEIQPEASISPSCASGRLMSRHPSEDSEQAQPIANESRPDTAHPPGPRLCGELDTHNFAERGIG
jgi:hypothetical protein